jgi:hypothetical protein
LNAGGELCAEINAPLTVEDQRVVRRARRIVFVVYASLALALVAWVALKTSPTIIKASIEAAAKGPPVEHPLLDSD